MPELINANSFMLWRFHSLLSMQKAVKISCTKPVHFEMSSGKNQEQTGCCKPLVGATKTLDCKFTVHTLALVARLVVLVGTL